MRSTTGLLSIALLAFVAQAAVAMGRLESVMTNRVDGFIKIDAKGTITDHRIDTHLPEQLQQLVEKTIQKWSFVPVLVDGKAVPAEATMRITLAALPDGNDLIVNVDNVIFGSASGGFSNTEMASRAVTITKESMPLPIYPEGLLAAGVQGNVLLYLGLTNDGLVQKIYPAQVSLINVKGGQNVLIEAVDILSNNAVSQAKKWRFNVTVHSLSLSPDDLTVAVPVAYRIDNFKDAKPGQWRTEVRTLKKESGVSPHPGLQDIGVSDIGGGEFAQLTTSFILTTKVDGTAL